MKENPLILLFMIWLVIGSVFTGCIDREELTVIFSVNSLPESRQKEIVINVLDLDNTSIKNAEICYEQISQSFMYNVGDYWDEGAKEVGTNTVGIYLDWWWGNLEPQDDVYDWDYLELTGVVNGEGELISEAEHVYVRLGVIATSAWIVGEGMDSFSDPGYPDWINQSDLEYVKTKYLEFVEALMNHLKFTPDFYMIEVEGNTLGINAGLTNEENIEWHKRFVNKIKEVDNTSKVSIVVTSHDLSPFMEEGKAMQSILIEQDRYPLDVTEFLDRMNDTDYDMISVFIQPFGWMSKGNWEDAKFFLDSLCVFDREVYVASIAFLSEEPVVPEELNPKPNGVNQGEEWSFIYYPWEDGHSEEWQKEQTLNLMNDLISNPQISGVHWDLIDYTEIGVGGQDFEVRLTTGFTSGYRDTETNEVMQGEIRLVYEPMKELWQSSFSTGTIQTDGNGVATFNGFPGTYRLIVSHLNYKTEELLIEV